MTSCGKLTVEPPFDSSKVTVASCPTPSTLKKGESTTIDVEVQNQNDVPANTPVIVAARPPETTGNSKNVVVGQTTAQIPAASTKTVSVTITAPDTTGDHGLLSYTGEATKTSTASVQSLVGRAGAATESVETGTLLTVGAGLAALGTGAYLGGR